MSRQVFTDFDEFADALPGIDGRFIPTARQKADWWIENAAANRSYLHGSQIGGAATFAGHGRPGVLTVALPMTDASCLRVDGQDFEPDAFILLQDEQFLTLSSQDVVRWVGASLPVNTPLIAPELLSRSGTGPRLRSPPPFLDRLRWVISRAYSSSELADFTNPTTAAAVEQEVAICLTHILERTVKDPEPVDTRPQLSRGRVIARTLSLIEANCGQPLFIEDICSATQVSERSLRNIFYEFFGVGPMRLLKVRQLYEIRAALLRAHPQRDTVARVAARFGIWDFSLFARNYKAMFGESPSRTLRTPPSDARANGSSLSWLHYASRIFLDDYVSKPTAVESANEGSHLLSQPLC